MATRPHDVPGAVGLGDRPLPITEVHVRGFRCFEELHVAGLTRVNLILGRNNSGKTSLLEAVEVVTVKTIDGLMRGLRRRAEPTGLDDDGLRLTSEVVEPELAPLFFERGVDGEGRLMIRTEPPANAVVSAAIEAVGVGRDLLLKMTVSDTRYEKMIRLGLDSRPLRVHHDDPLAQHGRECMFLAALRPTQRGLAKLIDTLLGQSRRERVLTTLRILDQRVRDLRSSTRYNVSVVFDGEDRDVALGSLGDGFRQLLAIALHLERAQGGVLLIDEIDTGLHYSVLTDLWRLVIEGARRLNVQVFATTHSRDCIEALGAVIEDHPELASDASAHRIDVGYPRTVRYAADKLATAARRHIEVR